MFVAAWIIGKHCYPVLLDGGLWVSEICSSLQIKKYCVGVPGRVFC